MRIYERRRNEWWAMKLIKPKFMIFFLSPHTAYPIYACIKFSDFLINQMSFPHPQLSIFLWCCCSLLIENSSVIYQSITDKTEQLSLTICMCRSPIKILSAHHMTARILPTINIIDIYYYWRGLCCLNLLME